MLRAGAHLSRDACVERASERACAAALGALGADRAAAGFVFVSGQGADLERAAARAEAALGTRRIVAVRGHGVAANGVGTRASEPPAVAVLALAGIEAVAFRLEGAEGVEGAIGPEVEAALGRSLRESDLIVAFADPLAVDGARLADGLRELQPAVVVGAGAALEAPGQRVVESGGPAPPASVCGLALRLPAPARIAVTQGCSPVTDALVVTRVSGHWVLELDGKPALDVYRELAGEPLAADLRRAAERLLVAVPRGGRPEAWVARRLAGFAPDRRAFATTEALRVGAVIRLALRDADHARADLAQRVAGAGPATAALYLRSSGRGAALFQHAGLESALVARALGATPVAGLSGSFEIAPLAGTLEHFAHAGVLIAFDAGD